MPFIGLVTRTEGSVFTTSATVAACWSWIFCDVYVVMSNGVSMKSRLPSRPSCPPRATCPPA